MREIKFRAWDLVNMIDNVSIDEGKYWYKAKGGEMGDRYGIQTYPIMQYTGLKDKNGKEIYEGNYLRQEGLEVEVKWDEFEVGFVFEDSSGSCMIMSPKIALGYEIFGNIYENPELIK